MLVGLYETDLLAFVHFHSFPILAKHFPMLTVISLTLSKQKNIGSATESGSTKKFSPQGGI